MVALTSRMQHERNYQDKTLENLSHMRRLDIDPLRVEMGWVIDFCAQSLRNIIIGMGSQKTDGTVYGKSITDPCLGWPDSERLILDLAALV